jgi:hypothetical protein
MTTGKICHLIAEYSARWVSKKNFSIKFDMWAKKRGFALDESSELCNAVCASLKKKFQDLTYGDIGFWLYDNFQAIKKMSSNPFQWNGTHEMFLGVNECVDETYSPVSMPPIDEYTRIFNRAVAHERCNDPKIIKDCEFIMWRFYRSKDFSKSGIGDFVMPERRFAFDRDWNVVSDFYSKKVFYRGIIDLIEYSKDYIKVTDYKSNRKIDNLDSVKRDPQLKLYLMAIHMLINQRDARLIASKDFLRHGIAIEFDCESPSENTKEMRQWVEDRVEMIEKELLKDPSEAFQPRRNEYCGNCHLNENLMCPLFNKLKNNNIEDVANYRVGDVFSAKQAWKRIECNSAENKLLSKKIKAFLETNEDNVVIDEKAQLSIFTKLTKEIDIMKMISALKEKIDEQSFPKVRGILFDLLNLSESSYEKFCAKSGVKFSAEEEESFVTKKTKSTLDALTKEEAASKDYIGFLESPSPE